jgi:predicted transposase YbfD/YdcC
MLDYILAMPTEPEAPQLTGIWNNNAARLYWSGYSGDGLTNREALEHGTNIFKWDTDEDGISDYDEIYVYGTDPLSPDTSGDGIYDGAALMLGLDPLESHEVVESCKTALSADGRVEVTAWGDGNVIMSPLQIWDSDNMILANLDGIVGRPVEITNGGFPIKYAEIRISYNREDLGDITEDELTIFYANTETQRLEEIDDVRVDKVNQVVIGTTTHFSPFFTGSMQMNRELLSDIAFVLDQSSSMKTHDPNNISVGSTKRFVEQSLGYNLAQTQRIGLVKTKEKSNEIKAIPELLDILSIKGCIVTIDAIGTQKDIVAKIKEKKADYVLSLKGNHPLLNEEVSSYFDTTLNDKIEKSMIKHCRTTNKGHGRIEIRDYYITKDISWLESKDDWVGLKTIGMVVYSKIEDEVKVTDTRYFICSIEDDPNKFAYAVRNHWGIESMHWSLDVTFLEDSKRVRKDNETENLSLLLKMAFNIIKMDTSVKKSMKIKRRKAGWNLEFLEQLLTCNK